MPTPKQTLITEAQGLLGDDANNSDVSQSIWDSSIASALRDLSRYSPLRKLLTLNLTEGQTQADLPADFLEVDTQSFDAAIRPQPPASTFDNYVFALQSSTAAASDFPGVFAPMLKMFADQTRFEFLDDGSGGRVLNVSPGPIETVTLEFVYLARHSLDDSVDTVPDSLRDLLLLKVCEYACRALSRLLAGDATLNPQYKSMADEFSQEFEARTRFRPKGIAG